MVASPLQPLTFCLTKRPQRAVQKPLNYTIQAQDYRYKYPLPSPTKKIWRTFFPLFYFCLGKERKHSLKMKHQQECPQVVLSCYVILH